MAHYACMCGVSIWNGYGPGGVNWDIMPRWQAEAVAKEHPEYTVNDVINRVEQEFNNGDFIDFWLCRRCRRIHIWDLDNKFVSYKKVPFTEDIEVDDIFNMEEWLAYSDYDIEDDKLFSEALECPYRYHQYFVNEDKSKIYVLNTDTDQVEFIYEEEVKELDDGIFRNENGLYRNRYEEGGGYRKYLGSYYLDGSEVEYKRHNGDLSDAVYGAVIGDALGVPYEFNERGTFECKGMVGYGTHNQPAGTWSDDSSMILATCKSIKENNGKINIDDIRNKFRDWLYEGKYTPFGQVFDSGNTTSKAIVTGESQDDEYSNGNGSLMRILPLAFIDCTEDEIRAVSAITHGHWISTEACVIYVNIIKEYLKNGGWGEGHSFADIIHALDLPAPFDRLHRIDELSEEDIKSGGYVVHTLETAVWCVLTSDSFTECLLKAVNLGDDTDTTACVAGGLGSLVFSFDSFPDSWVNAIKNNDLIQDCLF